MNWKVMVAIACGVLAGVTLNLRSSGAVHAAPLPTGSRYQLQNVIANESNGDATESPVHEVFMLDTETGNVWKYHGLEWGKDKDGTSKVFAPPTFTPVAVAQVK